MNTRESKKMTLIRNHFDKAVDGKYSKIILVIVMYGGNRELIINDDVANKLEYINSAYDDDLKLKTNPLIKIEDYMLVNK